MEMIPYEVVRFCSIECKMQQSGEISVLWMVDGWRYARDRFEEGNTFPNMNDVLALGRIVEPHENFNGFRKHGVRVGRDIYPDWENIPVKMMHLLSADQLTPEEWFKAYEECHPFGDGNGRTGILLMNWIKGTLLNPVWAPNFWHDPRRTVDYGA